MPEEKHRLGGMALANGVLVHGPTAWACAVRAADGTVKVAAGRKRVLGSRFQSPLLRGPAKLAEAVAFLPELRRVLPEAQLPFARARVAGGIAGSALLVQVARRSRLGAVAKELLGGALSIAPAVLSLREGSVAAYHGAEHITIGSYEHGTKRTREHERCGTHLVGPIVLTGVAGGVAAQRLPERLRPAGRLAASLGSLVASGELLGWMARHPERPLAKLLARPGHELQHRLATEEPTPAQLEVADAALRACLQLEHQGLESVDDHA